MIGQQIKLVFVGVPPSMNQFNGRTNVQVYRAVKARLDRPRHLAGPFPAAEAPL